MSAPSMKERQACWEARDKLWKCLDENMEDTSKCDKSRCSFESVCPQQWVSDTGQDMRALIILVTLGLPEAITKVT